MLFREIAKQSEAESASISGTDIFRSISKLAKRRTDIFGVGEQGAKEAFIGRAFGEEKQPRQKPSKTIWDGQQETIDATTRAAQKEAMQQQISKIPPKPEKKKVSYRQLANGQKII